MTELFLSLGSNINPEKNIPACLRYLQQDFKVLRISSVYETVPVGPAGDGPFWNLVLSIERDLEGPDLQKKIQAIEVKLGRKRKADNKFAPRTIDIDVLPQKDYQKHGFIMVPLAEIYPDGLDPQTGESFTSLSEKIPDREKMVRKIRT